MTDPHPPPPSAPVERHARSATPIWLLLAVSVGTVALIGGVLYLTGSLSGQTAITDDQSGSAAGAPTAMASTPDGMGNNPEGREADPHGWEACRRLHDLGATTFDTKINQDLGQLARRSTHEEIAARGTALVNAATRAPDQDPIEANLAISRAQLDLTQACERTFGGTSP